MTLDHMMHDDVFLFIVILAVEGNFSEYLCDHMT